MLLIAGTLRIEADDRDAVVQVLNTMIEETKKEAGCVSYAFSSDFSDPTLFHLFEEWESDDHLQAHFATPHMAEYRAKLAQFDSLERSIYRYDEPAKTHLP